MDTIDIQNALELGSGTTGQCKLPVNDGPDQRAKGEAALLRHLKEADEAPDNHPWGGAFTSTELTPKGRYREKKTQPSDAGQAGTRPKHSGRRLPPSIHPELVSPQQHARVSTQINLIKALHRHQDGYISFAVRNADGTQQPAFAIRARALERALPGYVECLTRDSLLSINAGYVLARRDRDSDVGAPNHKSGTLRYLCACYCDVDYYRCGLTFTETQVSVLRMVAAGELPKVSMIVDSGRGMWLFWLLHDHSDPTHAHIGAWAKSEFDPLMIYSQVNQAICDRLRQIGGDPKASDGARYIRTPQSYRSDTGQKVHWEIRGDQDSLYSYTLWELADFFGVRFRRLLPLESKALKPRQHRPGRHSCGQQVATQRRLGAINTLIARRNGLQEGDREAGIRMYAIALRYAGIPEQQTLRAALELASYCSPPFPKACTALCVKSAYKRGTKRWKFDTFSRVLGVTREEAEVIAQRIGRSTFPAAGEKLQPLTRLDGSLKQHDEREVRRALIKDMLSETTELKVRLSYRAIAKRLAAGGHEISYVTVGNDLEALGVAPDFPSVSEKRLAALRLQKGLPLDAHRTSHDQPYIAKAPAAAMAA